MLYLYLGYAFVGLFILLSVPIEDELSSSQLIVLVALSLFFDFLPVLGYLVGRRLSKTSKIHWETLLFLGAFVGLITQVILPEIGSGTSKGSSLWYISACLFFVVAFVPPKLEKWRLKST